MGVSIINLFPAFRSLNYRYYFVGQLISQIGTWLQVVAQGWLVLTLTNSPLLIGLVAATLTLPLLLFSLFGGVVVDRFDKKKIIIFTQIGSMILAFILGLLTVLNIVNIWHIMILSFLLGTINAIDMPARQAFVSEMVERDKVNSAIALNAGIFNAARVVGPSLAGLLIVVMGVGGAFLLNSLTYIAAIIVQFKIIPLLHPKPKHAHPLKAIKDGVNYTWSHPKIRFLIALTAVVSIFGWSYTTLMPYIAKSVFDQGAQGLGYLYAAAGFGALIATFVIGAISNRYNPYIFIIGGNILFALSMICFSFTNNLNLAYLFLFLGGFGLLTAFPIINSEIQHSVEPHFRGRVISIYLLMFVGLFPVGSFQIGLVSEYVGVQMAVRIGSVIVLIAAICAFFLLKSVLKKSETYVSGKKIEKKLKS